MFSFYSKRLRDRADEFILQKFLPLQMHSAAQIQPEFGNAHSLAHDSQGSGRLAGYHGNNSHSGFSYASFTDKKLLYLEIRVLKMQRAVVLRITLSKYTRCANAKKRSPWKMLTTTVWCKLKIITGSLDLTHFQPLICLVGGWLQPEDVHGVRYDPARKDVVLEKCIVCARSNHNLDKKNTVYTCMNKLFEFI